MPAPVPAVSPHMGMPPMMPQMQMVQAPVGPPAPKAPAQSLSEADPDVRGLMTMMRGRQAVVGEHGSYNIRVVTRYRHLGGVIHHVGDQRQEARQRVAVAHQTLSTTTTSIW